jgi:hypothetical protein
MEYLIITTMQIIGISLSFIFKIKALDTKFPDFTKKQIFAVFWDEDWTTLLGSVIVLALNLVVHFIMAQYTPHIFELVWLTIPYMVWSFGIALILGWGGQRLIYNWLGSAEKALDKKVTEKLG